LAPHQLLGKKRRLIIPSELCQCVYLAYQEKNLNLLGEEQNDFEDTLTPNHDVAYSATITTGRNVNQKSSDEVPINTQTTQDSSSVKLQQHCRGFS
jgi:hypothetical protein